MTIEFTIKSDVYSQLSVDGTYRLITKKKYTKLSLIGFIAG